MLLKDFLFLWWCKNLYIVPDLTVPLISWHSSLCTSSNLWSLFSMLLEFLAWVHGMLYNIYIYNFFVSHFCYMFIITKLNIILKCEKFVALYLKDSSSMLCNFILRFFFFTSVIELMNSNSMIFNHQCNLFSNKM